MSKPEVPFIQFLGQVGHLLEGLPDAPEVQELRREVKALIHLQTQGLEVTARFGLDMIAARIDEAVVNAMKSDTIPAPPIEEIA